MKTILQALYDGEIYPDEIIVSKDPEYHHVNQKIGDEKAYLKQKLLGEDYQHLEGLDNLYNQSNSMDSKASFLYGFRLGAMLIIEVFMGKGELVRGGD